MLESLDQIDRTLKRIEKWMPKSVTFNEGQKIVPQPQQQKFLDCTADIALYGGAAGGGKSVALLLDFARESLLSLSGYGGVIFRRTFPQIRNEGGLWAESGEYYPALGGVPYESRLEWRFKLGTSIRFAHLQHEKNIYDWQGSQLCRIGFDELTHFTDRQFWYLLGRARTILPIAPQVRATCNPDADSWVAKFIGWWLDPDGFPIAERSGLIRWFVRVAGQVHWAGTKEELEDEFPGTVPKSFTFIPAKLADNQVLLDKDPGYLANLQAQHPIERARLLEGNWLARTEAGKFFNRGWIECVPVAPQEGIECRFWDFAATAKERKGDDPDWTVGIKVRLCDNGIVYVVDAVRLRTDPAGVEQVVLNTASNDGQSCLVGFEQEPGSSGKLMVRRWRELLAKYTVRTFRPVKSKTTRATPMAIAAEAGGIKFLSAPWTDAVLSVLHEYPDGKHDDDLDALSGAFGLVKSAGTQGLSKASYGG